MNPKMLAIVVSTLLGISMVPWNHALKHMTTNQFLMMLGAAFIAAGEMMRRVENQPFTLTVSRIALVLAVMTIVPYVLAMCLSGPMYRRTSPETLPVVAAILAAFAVPAMAVNAIVFRTLPTLTEAAFIFVTIFGVIGLSLFGRH